MCCDCVVTDENRAKYALSISAKALEVFDGAHIKAYDIGWAEAVALEMALLAMRARGFHDADVMVRGDNTGVIGAHERGRGRNPHTNAVIRRINFVGRELNVTPRPFYVRSADNLADPYSRGVFAGARARANFSFPIPPELQPYLERATL